MFSNEIKAVCSNDKRLEPYFCGCFTQDVWLNQWKLHLKTEGGPNIFFVNSNNSKDEIHSIVPKIGHWTLIIMFYSTKSEKCVRSIHFDPIGKRPCAYGLPNEFFTEVTNTRVQTQSSIYCALYCFVVAYNFVLSPITPRLETVLHKYFSFNNTRSNDGIALRFCKENFPEPYGQKINELMSKRVELWNKV